MTTFALIAALLLGFIGQPLFIVILALALVGFVSQGIPLSVIGIELYRLSDTTLLAAIPLFTFTGFLLSESNSAERLVRLSNAWFGWMPAGLAIISLMICAMFTAFTGASGATIVALGALLYPALKKAGYPKKFSLGMVTSSGSLGLLLPPSVPLILYGVLVQQMNQGYNVTIDQLFIAGILPTILMVTLLSFYSFTVSQKAHLERQSFSFKEAIASLSAAKWELPLPVFVLGGIYSGFFAVSEAAAMIVFYTLIVEVFIYREIPLKKLPQVVVDSMVMVGGIMIVLAAALALASYFVDAQIPTKLFEFIQAHVSSKLMFLILLNVFLLLLGAVLDIFAALVLVIPLILPVAVSYGVDPIHLGIIFLANMQIGYLTPPVGMNLFIASFRFKEPVTTLYKACLPYMAYLLVALLVITYVPWLSLVFVR